MFIYDQVSLRFVTLLYRIFNGRSWYHSFHIRLLVLGHWRSEGRGGGAAEPYHIVDGPSSNLLLLLFPLPSGRILGSRSPHLPCTRFPRCWRSHTQLFMPMVRLPCNKLCGPPLLRKNI